MFVFPLVFLLAYVPFFVKKRQRRVLYFLFFLLIGLVGGLRFETGYDWLAYELDFNDLNLSTGVGSALSNELFEPGYVLFCYFLKWLGFTIQGVFLIAALFQSYSLSRIISTRPISSSIPIVLYMGFCYLLQYFIVVRFSIAASFVYLALIDLLRGRQWRFFALVVLGSLFHLFAIVFLSCFLFIRMQPRLLALILTSSASLIAGVFLGQGFIVDILNSLGGLLFLSKYAGYASALVSTIPVTVFLFLILNIFYCLFILRMGSVYGSSGPLINLSFGLSIVLIISIGFGYSIPSIWNRVMCIAIPVQGLALASLNTTVPRPIMGLISWICSAVAIASLVNMLFVQDSWFLPYESVFSDWLNISSGIGRRRMEQAYFR